MANFNLSSNMVLPIPTIGVDPGPDWAANLNASLTLVDQHDHSSGKGVQITPAGMNITSDLAIQNNNLTLIRSTRFSSQSAALSGGSDIGALYVVGADLYYNDVTGNVIRLTQSGSVAGSNGSISGLTSPASATYVSAQQTFIWQSAANTPANLDSGSIVLRNIVANSKGLTLAPPSSMGSNYTLTLPQLPGSTSIVTLDASGNFGASYAPDNTTISVVGSALGVKAGGITKTQLATAAIPGALSQTFTATGTYTTGPTQNWVYIKAIGGGGGGGEGAVISGNGAGGGGGSCGNIFTGIVPVTPSTTYTVTIGAGGTGGSGGGTVGVSGTAGGATSFDTLISVAGGTGGGGGNNGTGGSGSTTGFTIIPLFIAGGGSGGSSGQNGVAGAATVYASGGNAGSASASGAGGGGGGAGFGVGGSGGGGGNNLTAGAGTPGASTTGAGGGGGGGNGGGVAGAGGNGASGQLVVYWPGIA